VPIIIITLAVLFAYLGGLRVLPLEDVKYSNSRFTRILLDLTFRRRLLEVFLDFLLIGTAYYLAYLVENGLRMNLVLLGEFLDTLPVVLIGSYLIFFLMGVYRSVWRYFGLRDLLHLSGAAVGSGLTAAGLLFLLHSTPLTASAPANSPSPLILVLFTLFLFLELAASRSSFRILSYLMPRKTSEGEIPVLILGAGDAGILVVDWMRLNSNLHFSPVGFIDDDLYLHGRFIHGLKVLGGTSQLETILQKQHIDGLVIADDTKIADFPGIVNICRSQGCWIRKATLDLELLE
jgi:FlaA1/EpsC-like NDP-sugar epimerase